jgi:alkylhydroperoxidase family enzyme
MSIFTLHNLKSAPIESRPLLEKSLQGFGMIPNLHAVMAEAPDVLDAYQRLHELVLNCSLSDDEKTVVWQTINVEHECHYCVPAHTGIANMMGVDKEITNALRNRTPLLDTKLEALRQFTLSVIRERGKVSKADLDAFVQAGYGTRQMMEVILTVSQKVMSNYINHIAETPLDDVFAAHAWSPST